LIPPVDNNAIDISAAASPSVLRLRIGLKSATIGALNSEKNLSFEIYLSTTTAAKLRSI
jgi:hypothetical protein